MRSCAAFFFVLVACSSSRTSDTSGPPPPPDPPAGSAAPAFSEPLDASARSAEAPTRPPPDAAPPVPPPPAGRLRYMSDCSLTNPIAQSPCVGAAPSTRGLAPCASLSIVRDQSCGANAPSCYVGTTCDDGRNVAGDFLVCVDATPGRCMTRSAKHFKRDVHYLTAKDLETVVHQVQTLPLATFRYNDQPGGDPRLGFLIEDARSAPFVSTDGRHVDLYALLASSIAALQAQDKRIRALEQQLEGCARPQASSPPFH